MHYSSVISLFKQCWWFNTSLHHYKQSTCVISLMVHIFNWSIGCLNIISICKVESRFGLIWFNGISIFVGYLIPKLYSIHSWWVKGFNTPSHRYQSKNEHKAQLELELTYFKAAVQHFRYYTTGTLPQS